MNQRSAETAPERGRPSTREVLLGAEAALRDEPEVLRRGRLGLLVHPASLLSGFTTTHEAFARRFDLRALFSPQHGFFGEKQDNMIESGHEREPRLDLPVFSLYGEVRVPTEAMLDTIDVLAVDLQDVGCRVYTFIWTLTHCLEACGRRGVPVVVLDRPNPVGGVAVEGRPLEPGFESFVGRASIPMRHGLTLGELARWCNASMEIGAELHVVPAEGWRRSMTWADTGLPWVPPSPNLPRVEGVDLYPGQVLFEGTNLSEGRGTTTPFECCGAPFVDPERWVDELARAGAPEGVVLRPVRFEPISGKWQGERCGGVVLHVLDRASFAPLRTSLQLLAAAWRLWPDRCRWSPPPYEYETERLPIDCIAGGEELRRWVEAGDPADAQGLDRLCLDGTAAWRERSQSALLYRS